MGHVPPVRDRRSRPRRSSSRGRKLAALLAVALLSGSAPFGARAGAADGEFDPPLTELPLPLPPLALGSSRATAIRVQPDGRIVIVAEYWQPGAPFPHDLLLYRLLPDGELDPTLGLDGIEVIGFSGLDEVRATSLELAPDGDILIGVWERNAFSLRGLVLRRLPDGSPNLGFGCCQGRAYAPSDLGPGNEQYDFALAADGTITAVGLKKVDATHSLAHFYRFTPEGVLDPTFGDQGASTGEFGNAGLPTSLSNVRSVLVDPEGRAVVAGRVFLEEPGSVTTFQGVVGRLDGDGLFDPGFAGSGYLLDSFLPVGGAELQRFESIVRYSDGTLLAAGNFEDALGTAWGVLVHLNEDGTHDTSWGFSGYSYFDFDLTDFQNTLRGCRLDAIERTVCLGWASDTVLDQVAVSRFEGPWFDTRFGTDGTFRFSTSQRYEPLDFDFDPNGRLLIVYNRIVGSFSSPRVTRLRMGLPFTDGFESGLLDAWSATNP